MDALVELGASPWPEFLNHDPVVRALWPLLYELAPEYQFGLLDEAGGLAAMGNCIPIRWDGDAATLPDRGIDAAMEDGVDLLRAGAAPTAACALMIVVAPERLGQGLSAAAIRAMAGVVARQGLSDLVAPVRPTWKDRYPLVPMERYVEWRRDDGLPFDPWIRTHVRAGGRIVGPAGAAMRVAGSVADWERWTGMSLPDDGDYVVPGGLVPVRIDRARDVGEYVEPACWVHHRAPPSVGS